MIGGIDGVNGACRAERPGLVHRALIGGQIAIVIAKTERVGRDRVGRQRTVDFVTGMPGLLETSADTITVLIRGVAKSFVDAACDPGPIVGARWGAIGIVAVRERGWRQDARLECAILVIAQLRGADRRRTGDEYQLVNIGIEPLPPEAIVDGAIMDSGAVIDVEQKKPE